MFGKRENNGKCSKILKTDECGKECITFLCTILVHYLETFKIMTKILNNLNNQVTEFVTRSLRAHSSELSAFRNLFTTRGH